MSTSSASGLLWREIATVIGVSARARPGDEAPDAAEAPTDEVVHERHAAIPISACGTSRLSG